MKNNLENLKKGDFIDGEIAIVNLDVRVIFRRSTKIVTKVNEQGVAIKYKAGYIMDILPNQSFIYNNNPHKIIDIIEEDE